MTLNKNTFFLALLFSIAVLPFPSRAADFDPKTSGYRLTFDDEFNQLSISNDGSGTTWESKFYWMNAANRRDFLDPSVCGLGYTPFTINNGTLEIQVRPVDSALKSCGGIRTAFTGGHLDTHKSFSQEYGYFEVRARASAAFGTWFAFWLLPQDGSWPPEIDVTEILGRLPTVDNVTNHTDDGGHNTAYQFAPHVDDLTSSFHNYGVLWTPVKITFYFDGMEVAETPTRSDEHKPFYLILAFHTGTCGDHWAECPRNTTEFRADAAVRWVQVWQADDLDSATR